MQFASSLSPVDTSPRPPSSPFNLVSDINNTEGANPWALSTAAGMNADGPSGWLHVPPTHMPWGTPLGSQPGIMRFTAENMDKPGPSGLHSLPFGQCKRKIEPEVPFVRSAVGGVDYLPLPGVRDVRGVRRRVLVLESFRPSPKQHITEEKMAAHMRQLHISSSYTSHEQQLTAPEGPSLLVESEAMAPAIPAEDKAFKRLVLCEEIRQLQREPILPASLLQRMERPSMALVLWQPPAGRMSEPLSRAIRGAEEVEEDGQRTAPTPFPSIPLDNNNTSTIDLNTLHRFGQQAFPSDPDTQEMDM